ncbi:MAG: hypothetical protein QOK16_3376 [Solirubrobacteraceae bacterium]|nr:hypothetical protein [Solirubrobacteraceae bacterium]
MTSRRQEREPYRMRLPGLVSDQDIGLGDVITKSTTALGIRPCGGCAQRAEALNRWMVFAKGSSQRGQ